MRFDTEVHTSCISIARAILLCRSMVTTGAAAMACTESKLPFVQATSTLNS